MSADVLVVGGGVIGLAVANALLRAGLAVTSVFPPPSDEIPLASRAAGAMLGAFGESAISDGDAADSAFEFRLRAQRCYPEWLAEICDRAGHCVHQARGTFVIANNTDPRDRPSVRMMKRYAERAGEPAEYVEPEDIPGLTPSSHHAPGLCLHLPNEHSVDSDQLLAALAASAATFDGWTHLSDSVTAARTDGEGWIVETLAGQAIAVQHVVLSAGSRSFDVLAPGLREAAGLPELYFGKGVSCVVSGGPAITSTIRTPNRAFACGIHIVPRAGGLLYLGATNQLGSDYERERGMQPGELHNLFDQILHQISTELRETRIESLTFGYRPIAAHGRPVIGATDLPGLSVATGTYRDGVLMAPLVGAIVAAGVIGDQGPANPFPANLTAASVDGASLVDIGIRDIIALSHEPGGELPYDRAEQLRKYVTTLFHLAIDENGSHQALRDQIRDQLERVPMNETMHTVFRKIIMEADERGRSGAD
ncbi:MAG TPA: FAD-dependent oxidoreductase [Solirubrobacteraceae bacterium]